MPGDVPVVMTADPGPTLATQGTYSAPAGNVPVSNPISTVPATSDSVPSSVSVPMTTISAVVATTTSQQPTTTTATHHPKPPKPTPTTTTTVCVLLLC
ncbi:MAG TPA: hypothetical protein VHW44_09470 [Pseudonocardiaceae bacterium]|nr:hypothetical protein [Pseudonocardiaceae bacterium]